MARISKRAQGLSTPLRARIKKSLGALVHEVTDGLRVDGDWAYADEQLHSRYGALFHSNTRTTAMVLLALLQARPKHVMIPRLVRWFIMGKKSARFRNTQEAAWALLALWDYARIVEKEKPSFEAVSGWGRDGWCRPRSGAARPPQSGSPFPSRPSPSDPEPLTIGKKGPGTLFYLARLRYARSKPIAKSRDRGFVVKKGVEILDVTGKATALKGKWSLRRGDTVRVTLQIRSCQPRRYVVVDDPLPAGLEPLDTSLYTSSTGLRSNQILKKTSRCNHHELRDDRVLFFRDTMPAGTLTYTYLARATTAGTFVAPPAKAKEMYTPEIFGHTPTQTWHITRRR